MFSLFFYSYTIFSDSLSLQRVKARDAIRITAAEMKYVRQQKDTLGQIIKQIQRLRRN
jgi:hypothetical protein